MNDIMWHDNSVSNLTSIWQVYSHELLQWKSHGESQEQWQNSLQNTQSSEISRLVRMGEAKQVNFYILLAFNADIVLELVTQLQVAQSSAHILILEDSSGTATFCNQFLTQNKLIERATLLYDSSPWALFMLTFALGLIPQKCAMQFCQPPQTRSQCLQTWRKLFLGSQWEEIKKPQEQSSLSLHVIVHPEEPHLESFFAHIPEWIHEVLVLWDAKTPCEKSFSCKANIRHFAHELQSDFSAQRNRLLAQSSGDFVLYLDADERFNATTWNSLQTLLNHNYSGGVIFPRFTFEGDSEHIRMGHGLWPDVQLRLFPHTQKDKVRFVNKVHERLEGLDSSPVLAAHLPIWHYSHIFKSAQELEQRLAVFNAAGDFTHTLSAQYPSLSKDFFLHWQNSLNIDYLIRIPI